MADSTATLEAGGGSDSSIQPEKEKQPVQAAHFMRTSAMGDLPGGTLEVQGAVPASTLERRQTVVSRPNSAGSDQSSPNRNSGVMVEEEPSTWLRDYGVKINGVTLY